MFSFPRHALDSSSLGCRRYSTNAGDGKILHRLSLNLHQRPSGICLWNQRYFTFCWRNMGMYDRMDFARILQF